MNDQAAFHILNLGESRMAKIKFKGSDIHTKGSVQDISSVAHDFMMTKNDLSDIALYSIKAKYKLLNIFPSLDTDTCAKTVKRFNKEAASFNNVAVINLSLDLPFAQKRFCVAEGIDNAITASVFRSDFFTYYPVEITDGPLKGLCSRVIIVLNDRNEILHSEQVLEITKEPDYSEALRALQS